MDFRVKRVIITGASAGIGRHLAESLARQGAHLVLAARSVEALAEVVQACLALGGKAIAVPTDVSDKDACRHLVEATVEAFGGVDVLVNNAGITIFARFDAIQDLGIFERLMQVNYLGSVYCTHYALPYLKASRGLLVAVSSLTGKTGVPTRTAYAATKHAVQGFFDSLRIELAGTGVDVLVISPGIVATDIRARALGPDGQPLQSSYRDESRDTMSVETCVQLMISAMAGRRRELVMTARAKVGLWLKLIAPGLVDRMAARTIGAPD